MYLFFQVDPPIRAQCDIRPGSSDIKGTIHITQPVSLS